MSTTYEQDEPYEPSSGSSDYPPPATWTRPPDELSGRPTGTQFQERLMDAVTGSEFAESTVHGQPARRTGGQLNISYDQALAFLGWTNE